jgi:hypothetical protein
MFEKGPKLLITQQPSVKLVDSGMKNGIAADFLEELILSNVSVGVNDPSVRRHGKSVVNSTGWWEM